MRFLLTTSLAALLAASGVAAVTDFSFYPLAAQDCLYKASNSSSCPETSVSETNKCLCSNGGNFVTNAAKCLGTSDPKDVSTVYSTMRQACSDSKTPLSVTEQQFLSAASPKSSTTSSASRTSTSTSTTSSSTGSTTSTSQSESTTGSPTPTGSRDHQNSGTQQGEKGLSTGAKAGIIAGGAIAGVALLAAVVILLVRRKRRKDSEESHPMLLQGSHFYPTPGETVVVGHNTSHHSGGSWQDEAKWRPTNTPSPDPRNSTFNWETPYDPVGSPPMKQGFATPPLQQQGYLTPLPPLQQGGFPAGQFHAYQPPPLSPQPPVPQPPPVFELVGSSQQPAEAPGSTISGSTAAEIEGTPVPSHGFDPRPKQGPPPQFGSGGYR